MNNLPRKLYTTTQVRELDRQIIEVQEVTGLSLMEKAGEAAFETLQKVWPDAWRIVVVCGSGNNGGDGYVIARLAHAEAKNVTLLQVGDHSKLKGDAKICADKLHEAEINCEPFSSDRLEQADVIVDAIFGTGLDREIGSECKKIIETINTAKGPVFSVDIPSGLNANTGRVMGTAIEAKATVSFIGLKQGLLTGEGPAFSGQVWFSDLDVPDEVYAELQPSSYRIDLNSQKQFLQTRMATGHKGLYGHALIIGGESGFAGAARMAAEAAGRSGAGLVSLATRTEHAIQIVMGRPEVMAHGVDQASDLLTILQRATVLAVGPGLGQAKWGQEMLAAVLETDLPLVIDADALNLIAQEPVRRDNWILTPHPGEAARLLDCSIEDVQQDRFAAVKLLQSRFGGVVILKGAGTLIASDQGCVSLCDQGNPGMATGGMGDILTGIITGLLAQGLSLLAAAQTGVCVHASAGDLAAQDGQRGMLAMDLMVGIRQLVNPKP